MWVCALECRLRPYVVVFATFGVHVLTRSCGSDVPASFLHRIPKFVPNIVGLQGHMVFAVVVVCILEVQYSN